jgi:L-threonylcarbamoyladenylate synthase
VGLVVFGEPPLAGPGIIITALPLDPRGASSQLYAALFELEQAGVAAIVCAMPPGGEDWLAVRDRLERAAHKPASPVAFSPGCEDAAHGAPES